MLSRTRRVTWNGSLDTFGLSNWLPSSTMKIELGLSACRLSILVSEGSWTIPKSITNSTEGLLHATVMFGKIAVDDLLECQQPNRMAVIVEPICEYCKQLYASFSLR